ncbi:MAG: hypothetical protein K0Q50_2174 [Vampirovibrio sp.]|jgi:hypothetical protein|nr:hypothetical protein [Vampirovibrio sp.]
MMRVIGPTFGGVYKVNYKDVSGRDHDFTYRKEESSSQDAIKDVFQGREQEAALVKTRDPKDRQFHTYVVTNDAKDKTLSRVQKLVGRKAYVPTQPPCPELPLVHHFVVATSLEDITNTKKDVPTVDFEYAYRAPVRKDEFFRKVGLTVNGSA